MHSDVFIFTRHPNEYKKPSEDEIFESMQPYADYVQKIGGFSQKELNEYAMFFAREIDARAEDNCVIINNPMEIRRKYLKKVFRNTSRELDDAMMNLDSMISLFAVQEALCNYHSWWVYDNDNGCCYHITKMIDNLYFEEDDKPLKLYLMNVYDYHY